VGGRPGAESQRLAEEAEGVFRRGSRLSIRSRVEGDKSTAKGPPPCRRVRCNFSFGWPTTALRTP
jgi:hypothetical protein